MGYRDERRYAVGLETQPVPEGDGMTLDGNFQATLYLPSDG